MLEIHVGDRKRTHLVIQSIGEEESLSCAQLKDCCQQLYPTLILVHKVYKMNSYLRNLANCKGQDNMISWELWVLNCITLGPASYMALINNLSPSCILIIKLPFHSTVE